MSLFDSLYEERSGTGTETSEAPDDTDDDTDGATVGHTDTGGDTAGDTAGDGTAGDTAGDGTAGDTADEASADDGMDAAATPRELDAPDEPVGIDDLEELARAAAAGSDHSSSEHLDEGTGASTDESTNESFDARVGDDTHETVDGASDENSDVAAESARAVEELGDPAPTGGVFDLGADQAGGGEEASEDHDEAPASPEPLESPESLASPEPLGSPEPAAGGEPPAASEVGPRRPSQTEVSEAAGDFAALISPPADGAPGVAGGDRSDGPTAAEPSTASLDDGDPSGAVDLDEDRETPLAGSDSDEGAALEAPHGLTGPRLGVDLLPSGRALTLPVPKPRPELFKKVAVLVLLAVVGFMVHRVVLADGSDGAVEQPAREAPSSQDVSPGGDTGASPGGDTGDADDAGEGVDAEQLATVEAELRDAAVAVQAYHAETGDFAADVQLLDELVAGTEVVAAGEAPAQGTLSMVTDAGAACFETVVAGDTVAAAGVTAEGVRFSSATGGASLCTTDAAAIASWASSLSLQ